MTDDRLVLRGMLEMVLEVADLERAVAFYRDRLHMAEVERWGEPRPAVWLAMGPNEVLGLWLPRAGGPGMGLHGGRGGTHVHFAVYAAPGTLDAWAEELRAAGLEVDGPIEFDPSNRSIYVDDPDGNVVEIADWRRDWGGAAVTKTR